MFSKKLLSLVPQLKDISFETDPVMDIFNNFESIMKANGLELPLDSGLAILSGALSYFNSGDNKPHVIVSEDVGSILTDKEITAITLHEIGHIKAGHFDTDKVGDGGYIYKIDNELQADQYAIDNGATATDLWIGAAKLTIVGRQKLIQIYKARGMAVCEKEPLTLEVFNKIFEDGLTKEMDPVSTARFEALRRYF